MRIIKTNLNAINRENFFISQKPRPLPKNKGSKAHEQFRLANSLLWKSLQGCYGKNWSPEKKLKTLQAKLHEETLSAKEFVEFAWVIHDIDKQKFGEPLISKQDKINTILEFEGYPKIQWRKIE